MNYTITRDGKEIELTDMEMLAVYNQVRRDEAKETIRFEADYDEIGITKEELEEMMDDVLCWYTEIRPDFIDYHGAVNSAIELVIDERCNAEDVEDE